MFTWDNGRQKWKSPSIACCNGSNCNANIHKQTKTLFYVAFANTEKRIVQFSIFFCIFFFSNPVLILNARSQLNCLRNLFWFPVHISFSFTSRCCRFFYFSLFFLFAFAYFGFIPHFVCLWACDKSSTNGGTINTKNTQFLSIIGT